jgi:hypothetical protein
MIKTNIVLQKAIEKGFNPKKIMEYHYKNKSVSLDEYARNYRKAIFEQNKDVKVIYLDMQYWIYLREVYLNETHDSKKIEFYNKMKQLFCENKIICPLSLSHVLELDKIKDLDKRKATIKIMEKYSKSYSLYFLFDIITEEIGNFFQSFLLNENMQKNKIYPLDKVSRIVGTPYTSIDKASSEGNLLFQKYFYDLSSFIDFSDYMDIAPENRSFDVKLGNNLLAQKINENKQKKYFKDFNEALQNEIAGFLKNLDPIIIVAYKKCIDKSIKLTEGKIQILKNFIGNSFKYCEEKTVKLMPTIYIISCLHAYFMVRKDDKYEGNDIDDILHVTVAIPYCDFVFTERKMNNRIQFQKEIKIPQYFNTIIEYKIDKVINFISAI